MCTRPKKAWQEISLTTMEPIGAQLKFFQPLEPINKYFPNQERKPKPEYKQIEVPCTHCPECLKARSLEWAIRCYCELHETKGSCFFFTLTYDEDNLPENGNLHAQHMTNFFKRLRKLHSFRYYYCGEYGEQLSRPHYHACMFDLDLDQSEFTLWGMSAGKENHISEKINKIWGHGRVLIGKLNMANIKYTSKYIINRKYGDESNEHYRRVNKTTGEVFHLHPEFNRMSRKPALGTKFFEKFQHQYDCPELDFFVLEGGFKAPVPKHFTRLLKQENPELVEVIKKSRVKKAKPRTEKELEYKEKFDFTMSAKNKRDLK